MKYVLLFTLVIPSVLSATTRMETLIAECPALVTQAFALADLPNNGIEQKFKIDVSSFKLSGDKNDRVYSRVKTQAEEAAKFVAWLYRQLPVTREQFFPFKFIEIVPRNLFGLNRAIELDGDTLIIRMAFSAYTVDELRSLWQAGKQFAWRSSERAVWKYANPSSHTMNMLKKGVGVARSLYEMQIRTLLDRHREDPTALRERLRASVTAAVGNDIGEDLGKLLEATSDDQLVDRTENLLETLKDEGTVNDFLSQLQFTKQMHPDQREAAEVYVRVIGSIYGVGNFHWIRVTAGYGSQARSVVTSTIPPFKKLNVWIVFSFIGVYTVDVIDVTAFAEKLYLASAIEAAFRTSSE